MIDSSPRYCPQCNTPITSDQRFCPQCGAATSIGSVNPTAPASGEQNYFPGSGVQVQSPTPPPPPSDSLTPPPPSYVSYPSNTPYPTQPTPPPAYATQPAYPLTPKKKSNIGIIAAVIVVVLLIASIGGYLSLRPLLSGGKTSTTGGTTSNNGNTGGGNSGNDNNNSGGGGNVSGSENLNLSVVYSGVNITITSVQQQNSFPDDQLAFKPGIVRVNFKEQNNSSNSAYYIYNDAARLVLPDGTTVVSPLNEQNDIGPDQAVTRTNWVDFQVQNQVDLSKLVLRLGQPDEAKIDIPLNASADLSKYQPKTYTLNKNVQYAGVDWTITTVTSSLSADGKQAKTGNRMITISVVANNHSSNDFFGFNYVRLKSGDITNTPTLESESKMPDTVNAGTTNVQGHCTFEMPDSNTSFTLIFVAQDQVSQATLDFQLQ